MWNGWGGWRGAWEHGVVQYFSLLLALILLPSGVAYFWGPGWGVVGGIGALLVYLGVGGVSGLGESRWNVRHGVLSLLLIQLALLMHLLNQLARPLWDRVSVAQRRAHPEQR